MIAALREAFQKSPPKPLTPEEQKQWAEDAAKRVVSEDERELMRIGVPLRRSGGGSRGMREKN